MIGTVVFDVGRVLLQWDPLFLYRKLFPDDAAAQAFLAETGLMQMHARFDGGRPFADGLAELAARFPHHEAALRAWDDRWEETIPGAIDGTVELLEELHARGVALYALTNYSAEKFPTARTRFPFFARFRDIVVSGEEGMIKPDARIYRLLLQRTGSAAANTLFIDDSAANIAAADAHGIVTHLFTDPPALRRALVAHRLLPG
jgi:HAD superfamily hydrolase (TIGR01509 family)